MILSDHLDMVGVQLRATWIQTRKANCDIVQQRVTTTVNSWKAGKFMPLVLRPWSVNSYVMSKVWFRCGSVDLRAADITSINSSIKSWIYADLLERPSEAAMCRPASHGGLEVASVKFKALAVLIRTFLETAAIPKFRHSLLHSTMFRYHVLQDCSVPDPGFLPYYPAAFFQKIKQVHLDTPLNVLSMSTSQWVRLLTEEGLTMETTVTRQYIPCRSELSSPTTDWDLSWRLCRLNGLGSELSSFNFKLLHGLLVTKQRIHQFTPATAAVCSHCVDQVEEDLQHALIHCNYNDGAGQSLLSVVQTHSPDVTAASLLRLELINLPEDHELPMVTLISALLLAVWDKRLAKSRISLYDIRATFEARCQLLRETRFRNQADNMKDLINAL